MQGFWHNSVAPAVQQRRHAPRAALLLDGNQHSGVFVSGAVTIPARCRHSQAKEFKTGVHQAKHTIHSLHPSKKKQFCRAEKTTCEGKAPSRSRLSTCGRRAQAESL